MTQDWRNIKLCDIGMDRHFYNRMYGRIGRLIVSTAKEVGRFDISDRITKQNEYYYYDSVTLGDIEFLGFDKFVLIEHIGPVTLQNFLERAMANGMEITSDKDVFFISKKLNMSVNEFHKWKNAVIEKSKSKLDIKPVEIRRMDSLDDIQRNLTIEGIHALTHYPERYFEEGCKQMKQINTAVLKYLKDYRSDIEKAGEIETLEKCNAKFNSELTSYKEIVDFKRKKNKEFASERQNFLEKADKKLKEIEISLDK